MTSTRDLMVTYAWRLIASGVAVVLLAIGTAVGVGAMAQHETVATTKYSSAEVSALKVDAQQSNVTITGSANPEVIIERVARAGLTSADGTVTFVGGTLVLSSGCPDLLPGLGCEVDFNIIVPSGLPVTVNHRAGEVVLAELSGPVSLDASQANISLSRLTGDVQLRASQTNLQATGLRSPTAEIDISFGSATFDFLTAPTRVRASASFSDLSLSVPPTPEGFDVSTDANRLSEIEVSVPTNAESPHEVRLSGTASAIRLN